MGTALAPVGPDARRALRSFHQVVLNTLVANVTSSYLWYALTFWAYLETRNVLATSIIGGSYMLLVALLGVVFGALVDHMRKKAVMVLSSLVTLIAYLCAGAVYLAVPERALIDWGGPWFWVFAGVILIGGVVENLRNIALSTTVTLLVPPDRRDRANGLVGTVQGVTFLVTSVFSGLSVGFLGMGGTTFVGIGLTAVSFAHLMAVRIPEREIAKVEGGGSGFTMRGVIPAIRAVPGLFALLLFSTFNNLVGGVFMSLMDPYGLELFSVQIWGIVLGVTSVGFIAGGAVVARFGLGRNPIRTMLLANLAVAGVGLTFTLREWWWLYVVGMFAFMMLMPMVEAAEQTVIQRVVPYRAQGRVFGFATSIETAAAPVTAFLIGPVAQYALIPYMGSDAGRDTFGWLLGDGSARGIALAFVGASIAMLVIVLIAFVSRPYRRLSRAYAETPPPPAAADATEEGDRPGHSVRSRTAA